MTTPTLGCRWCGICQREHGGRWHPTPGWHAWTEPDRDQIHARMRERLGATSADRKKEPTP